MYLKKPQYMYTCTLESKAISLLSVSRDILLSKFVWNKVLWIRKYKLVKAIHIMYCLLKYFHIEICYKYMGCTW